MRPPVPAVPARERPARPVGIWMPGFMQFALGAFYLATGFWLFYLMFADILNSVLKFTLYI
jgi:hypothetical protein